MPFERLKDARGGSLDYLKRLFARSGVREAATNSGWLIVDRIVRMGVGLFVGIWVARYLGPRDFGLLSYSLAFVALFGAIASLGLDRVVIRELVKKPQEQEELLGTAFILKLVAGFGAWFLAAFVGFIFPAGDPQITVMILIISGGFVFQSLHTIDLFYRSQVTSRYTVWAFNSAFLVISGVKVGLILNRAPVTAFAAAALGEVALGAVGLVLIFRMQGQNLLGWKFSGERARVLLGESWPLILSGLSVLVYMRSDQIMLGYLAGSEAVGYYAAAIRLSEVWYFLPLVVVQSVFPAIIRSREYGEEVYYRRLQSLFSWLVGISYAIAIPLTFFSGWLVRLLYGNTFSPSAAVLPIHVWAGVFVSLGVVQGAWNINEGLTMIYFYRTSLGALANVGLNLVLIPRFGIVGAAVATLVSYAVSGWMANAFSSETRRIFVLQTKGLILYGARRI